MKYEAPSAVRLNDAATGTGQTNCETGLQFVPPPGCEWGNTPLEQPCNTGWSVPS